MSLSGNGMSSGIRYDEGIGGHDQYRHDLRLLYLPRLVDIRTAGRTARGTAAGSPDALVPASHRDAQWLRAVLDKVSRHFASRIDLESDGCSIFVDRPDLDPARSMGAILVSYGIPRPQPPRRHPNSLLVGEFPAIRASHLAPAPGSRF
jgi:hypothetical protein